MAVVPTPEDVARAILKCAVNQFHVRPGEIAPIPGIQTKLHPQYSADDLNAGLNFLVQKGWITLSPPNFLKLTDAGFAEA